MRTCLRQPQTHTKKLYQFYAYLHLVFDCAMTTYRDTHGNTHTHNQTDILRKKNLRSDIYNLFIRRKSGAETNALFN